VRGLRWLVLAAAVATLGTSARADDVALGKKVYGERCFACHGATGGGDGPAAAAIVPPPRNFHDPVFWRGRTPAQLKLTVRDGRPGTMMAPFAGTLSEAEIDAVVAYVSTFRPAEH
jgi:high-affinity iron transporter